MSGEPEPDLFDFVDLKYQHHSQTSLAAAVRNFPRAGTQRRRVFDLLAANPDGFTDHEMQDMLQMNPSTQRPRRIELVEQGWVVDSGITRRTPSGDKAAVWAMRK